MKLRRSTHLGRSSESGLAPRGYRDTSWAICGKSFPPPLYLLHSDAAPASRGPGLKLINVTFSVAYVTCQNLVKGLDGGRSGSEIALDQLPERAVMAVA